MLFIQLKNSVIFSPQAEVSRCETSRIRPAQLHGGSEQTRISKTFLFPFENGTFFDYCKTNSAQEVKKVRF